MTAGHDAAAAEAVRVYAAARTGQADSAPFRAVGTSESAESSALLRELAIHGRVCSCTTPLINAQSANARNYAPSTQAYQAAGHRAAWRVCDCQGAGATGSGWLG
jgi:hypothetical protein